eukprot:2264791-Karenia_brevis.AAC.1
MEQRGKAGGAGEGTLLLIQEEGKAVEGMEQRRKAGSRRRDPALHSAREKKPEGRGQKGRLGA